VPQYAGANRSTMKKQWIYRARKSDNYTWDEDDKQKVIDILRDEFGIHSIRSDGLPDIRRIPDIETTDIYPTIYIELDGGYHGFGDDVSTVDKTKRRNQDYIDKGYKLIIINEADTDGYSRDKVIERLKVLGLQKSL